MRTTTSTEDNMLSTPNRGHHVRVRIDRGDSSYEDLTDLVGYNWLKSVKISDRVDSPTKTASVKLHRRIEQLSLAPFIDGSRINDSGTLVDIGHSVIVEAATTAIDTAPATGDWQEMFRGVIDEIDWAGDIVLSCRDEGANLMDWFIRTQRVYGSATGELLENVAQDIIDDAHADLDTILVSCVWNGTTTVTMTDTSELAVGDFIGYQRAPMFEISALVPNTSVTILNPSSRTIPTGMGGGESVLIPGATRITLYSETGDATTPYKAADTTGWSVKSFKSGRDHLLPILRKLAQEIGWECRYRWNDNVSLHVLTMYEPDRAASAADWTHQPSMYGTPTKCSVSRADIRNWWEVTYGRAGSRTSVQVENAASQAKYGFRPAMIAEASSSQIDTVTEATAMANAALSDTKEPTALISIPVPLFWPVMLGDMHKCVADDQRFDTDQTLAVTAFSHEFSHKGARTVLDLRGKPSGGSKRWLEIEGRAGVAPAPDHQQDDVADNVSVTAGLGTIVVEYDDPRTMSPPIDDWTLTECHVNAGSGTFTPSASTLRDVGRRTRFQIDGLTPGATYSVILRIIDSSGNVGASTTYIAQATQRVGPYHENTDGQQHALLRNNDFNIWTLGTSAAPDFWSVGTGTWDTHLEEYASDAVTGGHAIRMYTASGNPIPELVSDYIPVTEKFVLSFGAVAKMVSGSNSLDIALEYYNSSLSLISSDTINRTLESSYRRFGAQAVEAPANTRFMKISIAPHSGSSTTTIALDSAFVDRGFAQFEIYAYDGTDLDFSSSYVDCEWDASESTQSEGFVEVDNGTPSGSDYDAIEIQFAGVYGIHARCTALHWNGTPAVYTGYVELQLDEGGTGSWTTLYADSIVAVINGLGEYKIEGRAGDPGAVDGLPMDIAFIRLQPKDQLRVRMKTSTTPPAGDADMWLEEFQVEQLTFES